MQGFKKFVNISEVSMEGPFSDYFGEKNVLEQHTLVVFDTETTGLDTRIPHVQLLSISAAAFDLDKQQMTEKFNQFASLNPETHARMKDDEKYQIAGAAKYSYVDEFLKQSAWHSSAKHGTELQVIQNFLKFIKKFNNPLLVGYNVGFDMKIINSILKKNGQKPLRLPVVDVMKMVHVFVEPTLDELAKVGKVPGASDAKTKAGDTARNMLSSITNKYGTRSFTLTNIASLFNVLQAGAHVSMNDIEMTGKVLAAAINFIKDHQQHLTPDYLETEKLAREKYQQKLGFFKKSGKDYYRKYGKKARAIELIKKDVFSGVQSFLDIMANDLQKEKTSGKPNAKKISDLEAKIDALSRLRDTYDGDPTEIIKFIYNF